MQSASFPVNSVASQIPGAIPNNRFVPLTLPRAPRTQSEPMSDLCQGTMPAYPRQKINRPKAPHMTSKPNIILAGQVLLTSSFIPEPQASFPPTSSFVPETQTNLYQAPRNSIIPPNQAPQYQVPPDSNSNLDSPPEHKYRTTGCFLPGSS
jgi:hypothetical protein